MLSIVSSLLKRYCQLTWLLTFCRFVKTGFPHKPNFFQVGVEVENYSYFNYITAQKEQHIPHYLENPTYCKSTFSGWYVL